MNETAQQAQDATVVPTERQEPIKPAECMDRFKHHWHWIWEGSRWTNRVRCSTCGLERVNEGSQA